MSEKNVTSRNIAVQHNQLISSRHVLNASEQKLYLAMVAQIKKEDQGFHVYKIAIQDFVELTSTKSKNVYERAKVVSRSLVKKYVEITRPDGSILQTHLLSSADYKKGDGYVEVSFDPKLKPYLLELKKNFTSYDIRNILPLKSKYAIRIYELLKQFKKLGERTFLLEDLRRLLFIPDSYSYGRFKKYILTPAQEELYENTDLFFTFEETKTSRRVSSLRFIIHQKKVDLSDRPSPKLEILDAEPNSETDKPRPEENPNPFHDVLKAGITTKFGEMVYAAWFKNVEIVLNNDVIEIYFPAKFFVEWVKDHHLNDLKEIFSGSTIELKVNINLIPKEMG